MGFPDRLRYLREGKGLSQSDFGRLFNLSKQSISAYEKGDASPPVDTVVLMADYFKVSLDYLVGRDHLPAVQEEGILYGLTHDAKERIVKYAEFERNTQEIPEDTRDGSSGLTASDKNHNKLQFKKGIVKKKGTKEKKRGTDGIS